MLSILTIDHPAQAERNGIGSNDLIFRVNRSGDTTGTASVDFTTTSGSATEGTDYLRHSGTLHFTPGITEQLVRVTLLRDDVVEGDEDFFVELSNATGAELSAPRGRGIVLNDDTRLSINDVTVVEGDSSAELASFTVTLDPPVPTAVSVEYVTREESATLGEDFAAASGALVFLPNETSRTLNVPVSDDLIAEATEAFRVQLFNATGADIVKDSGLGLVLDNDSGAPSLVPLQPLGSLVYSQESLASLEVQDEQDTTQLYLADGGTITLVVETAPEISAQVGLYDPAGQPLALASASDAGDAVVVGPVTTNLIGAYRAVVSNAANTTGNYSLRWLVNADFENEAQHGTSNDTFATAQDISDSFIDLGTGATRGAVLGRADGSFDSVGPDEFGYLATSTPYTFEDISDSGTAVLSGVDDASWLLSEDALAGFSFDLYGTTYEELSINSNGMISLGADDASFENSDLIAGPAQAVIAPLWDDLDSRDTGATYWEVRGAADSQRLIVQWDEVGYFDSRQVDPITFQAVLYEADGAIEFRYLDLAGSNSRRDQGESATVGIKDTGSQPARRLLVAGESIQSALVSEGQGIRIEPQRESGAETANADFYRFEAQAGETIDVTLTGLSSGPLSVELYDEDRVRLTAGVREDSDTAAIRDLAVNRSGPYFLRVEGRGAEYNLLVMRDTEFDGERDSEIGDAHPLARESVALGYLSSPAPVGTSPPAGSSTSADDQPASAETADTPARIDDDAVETIISAPDRIIVRFAEGVAAPQRSSLIAKHGGEVVRDLPLIDGALIRLLEPTNVLDAANLWSANPLVSYAEPDYLVSSQVLPNDPSFSDLWGLHNLGQSGGTLDADIDAPEAWDFFRGSSSVVVASVDSGVDYTHPDLAGNMWVNPGEIPGDGIDNDQNGYVDDIHGIDTFNRDSDPMDDTGHGTHTAGTMGAIGDNGEGVVGVAWDVSIMALKFLSAEGNGTISGAVGALSYMTMMKVEYGVNVVVSNNSWSGSGQSRALEDVIRASNEAGIMFVTSAGNNRRDNDAEPEYPGSFELPGVITVAATDRNDRLAAFSSYGATSVDLAAPGVSVLSTRPNNRYGRLSGTSMAAPHVAGAVSMLMAYNPEASLTEVKQAILNGTDSIESLAARVQTGGRLNLARSLDLVGDQGDYYRFRSEAGNALVFATATPADVLLEVAGTLDPAIELLSVTGELIAADSNSAADGRNAVLTHTTAVAGEYVVRVLSESGQGEYILHADGLNEDLVSQLQIVASVPPGGKHLNAAPVQLQLDVTSTLLLQTVDATDVQIDGRPAIDARVVDGNTIAFALPQLGEGIHTVDVPAGSFMDAQGTPNDPFTSHFTLDFTPPHVVGSSPSPGDILAAGSAVVTVSFDEPLAEPLLDVADINLLGMVSGLRVPDSVHYDSIARAIRISFAALPDDEYQLRLSAGEFALQDTAGNRLDGEGDAFPTGDGAAGGDYVLEFAVDAEQQSAATFQRVEPLGSLVFASRDNLGTLHSATDTDDLGFLVAAEQTVSALVRPKDSGATLSVELVDRDGVAIVGAQTTSLPGGPVSIPPTSVPLSGEYLLRISSNVPSAYSADLWLNSVSEAGEGDSHDGHRIDLDHSRNQLNRVAAVGASEPRHIEAPSVVWGAQPASGTIVAVDPQTGEKLHSFAAPGGMSADDTRIGLSIADHGADLLYINSDVDPTRLYRLDPITGAVRSIETVAPDDGSASGLSFESPRELIAPIYIADMESDPGWSLDDGWSFGQPNGGGTSNRDPTRAFTGSNVIGYNLQGDYSNDLPATAYATTPAIDASNHHHVTLSFRRWLGIEKSDADQVQVEASRNGVDWVRVWKNPSHESIIDQEWQYQQFDISSVADGESTVFIRWGLGPTNDDITFPGWNIDDVQLRGVRRELPTVLLNRDGGLFQQSGYSGELSAHSLAMPNATALGGDGTGRQFALVAGSGILEYDQESPATIVNTIQSPAADIEALAFDGESIYAASATGQLFTIEASTGSVQGSVQVEGGALFGLGAITNHSGPEIVFREEFEGPSPTFTFNNTTGVGNGLWHLSNGRQQDGLPNHSGATSAYFGKAEKDRGGGNYDAGRAVSGSAISPVLSLPMESPITLAFNTLISVERLYDVLEVIVDDGETQAPLVSTLGGLTFSTAGTWRTIMLDLTSYAGQDVQLVFAFEADATVNAGEGWYIDDIVVTAGAGPFSYVGPDVDQYTIDLMAQPGRAIDIVLEGHDSVDFSSSIVELIAPDGDTVVAATSPTSPQRRGGNFDLAILGFAPQSDGVYTIRTTNAVEGSYTLAVLDSLTFNPARFDEPRSLGADASALGYVAPELTSGRLYAVETVGGTEREIIHELDPLNGAVVNSFSTPNIPGTFPFGINLAFDGDSLWYNSGSPRGDNLLYRLNPDTGAVIDIRRPANGEQFDGLARVGDELFAIGDVIQVYDAVKPGYPALRSLPVPGPLTVGLAGNHASGTLLVLAQSDSGPGKFFELDASTGSVLRTSDTASVAAEQGLAVAGNEVFVSEATGAGGPSFLTVYDRETLAVLRRMTLHSDSGAFIAGLGGDGFASDGPDRYTVNLVAGDTLTAFTETPLDSGVALNQLDPRLTLRGPAGDVIAAASSGHGDMKNARLQLVAEASGLYTIEVASEEGHGEYLLTTQIEVQPEIGGRKFHDRNANGIRETDEEYLNGWTIELLDTEGQVVAVQQTRDFDVNRDSLINPASERGWYRFDVEPGVYTVREVATDGWQQTFPVDMVARRAFDLDQQLDFFTTGEIYLNWGGAGEKWVQAASVGKRWYYVTPNGSIWDWDTTSGLPMGSPLAGALVAELSDAYYTDLSLLIDAAPAVETHTVSIGTGERLIGFDFGNLRLAPAAVVTRGWGIRTGGFFAPLQRDAEASDASEGALVPHQAVLNSVPARSEGYAVGVDRVLASRDPGRHDLELEELIEAIASLLARP